MSKPARPAPVKSITNSKKKTSKNTALPLFSRIDGFLATRLNKVFWISMGLTFMSGLLLFDIRISLAGDDSAYIIRAVDFLNHFTLPGTQGPLYPVILSPFVALTGIRLIPLKLLSLLFMLGFTALTFKAFKDRIPAMLLSAMLLLMAINSSILYYASQTFSEACFMFFQGLTLLLFFRYFLDQKDEKTFGILARQNILLALVVLCFGLTRSIGFAAVFAITGYFLIKGQWKNLMGFVISFGLVLLLFETLKFLVWRSPDLNFTVQVRSLFSKDYYNPTLGAESMMGFFHRFTSNSNLFLSTHLYTILGLRSPDNSFNTFPIVTILTYMMILTTLYIYFRKNNYLFFTALYLLVFLVITFFVAHTTWAQSRFIIPYIPYFLLVILALPDAALHLKKSQIIQSFLPVLFVILFLTTLRATIPAVVTARQVTDKFSGLTPDWKNYCKLSELSAAQLPPEALVACRKPSISFIYGHGKRFYGIMNLLAYPGDSILVNWKKRQQAYYLISANSINNTPVSKELYYAFKNGIVGYGISNDTNAFNVRFYVMDFPDSNRTTTLEAFQRAGITPTSDYNALETIMASQASPVSIVYPDSLLFLLIKAKVSYVMTANLRAFPSKKTNRTNNTVERFMTFIEFKYPEIRTRITQVGDDDEEPASLFQLNYAKYGFNLAR